MQPQLPWLSARILGLEDSASGSKPLLVGEVRRCVLEVANCGAAPVKSVVMKPHCGAGLMWMCLAPPASSSSTESPSSPSSTPVAEDLHGLDGSLLRVPLDPERGLAAGERVQVPVYVRAGKEGVVPIHILFLYDVVPLSAAVKPPQPRTRSVKWSAKVRRSTVLLARAASVKPVHVCSQVRARA